MMPPRALTRRERFCRLYDFLPVDRPVRWESIVFWPETVAAWKSAGTLPADVDPMTHYGFEPQPTISAGLGFTSMGLSGPPIASRVIAEDERSRVVEDDLGTLRRERTDGCSMPQFLRFPVESHADWLNKIKPRLDPAAHDYGSMAVWRESMTGEDPWGLWLLGIYAFWRNFWGEENLAYAFYDYPETLHDMARTWLDMHTSCLPRVLAQSRFDWVLFHEDMAFKNGPLIGSPVFNEFMAPYYRDLLGFLRGRGLSRLAVDSDGYNGPILDRFIDLGINGFFPYEVAAGNDIRTIRKRYPRLFIWGGLDKRVLNGSKDDIKREVMDKVPEVWASGGFIPSLDHSCQRCPQENFEYYLEILRGLFD